MNVPTLPGRHRCRRRSRTVCSRRTRQRRRCPWQAQPVILLAAALIGSGVEAFAVCGEFAGFAVFQCADLAYFAPPPGLLS
jgi:hypothetical protein